MNNKRIYLVSILVILIFMILGIKYIGFDRGIYLKTQSNQVAKNLDGATKINEDIKNIVTKLEGSNGSLNKNELKEVDRTLASTPIIYSEDYGVYMPIYTSDPNDTVEQKTELDKGAITYQEYGTPGNGNYDVFGHNAFEEGQYFTSFAKYLKKGDKVYLLAKDGEDYKKYDYTIKYKYEVDKDDVYAVYYESKDPIITIGTCKVPYKTESRIIWQGELTDTKKLN